jgi:glucosylceramidase
MYFGENGLNYKVCRVHMNSCDFSLASYSADDSPDDFLLTNFSIAHDKKWLIPFIKDAISVR